MTREEVVKLLPESVAEVAKLEAWYGELIAVSALEFADTRRVQVARFTDSILITVKNEATTATTIRLSPEGFAAVMNGYFDTYSETEQAEHHAKMVSLLKPRAEGRS